MAEIKHDPESSEHTQSQPKFIMPAVLKFASEEELEPSPSTQASPLMILFKSGFVPFGIFSACIAHLIAHQDPMSPKWTFCDEHVSKNKVKFVIRGGYCAILISRPQHLEIQVLRQHQSARCTRSYSDICYSVQQTVTRTLEDVISQMKYKPYAKIKTPIIAGKRPFDFTFTCCLEDSHANHSMKVVEDDDGLFAECCKTHSEIELMKEHLVWFNKVEHI